jgi:hypothetical protein
MVGVLVDLGPLSPALLPDNHALIIRTGGQDVPKPTTECYLANIKRPSSTVNDRKEQCCGSGPGLDPDPGGQKWPTK